MTSLPGQSIEGTREPPAVNPPLSEAPDPAPQLKSALAWLGTWKDTTAVIQSIATVLGIVAAAWWFFTQGTLAPHANLTQSVQTLKIHSSWRLVRLSVSLKNVGAVPVSLRTASAYIARVLPLEDSIQKQIDAGYTPVDTNTHEIRWPSIGDPYKIEPNAEIWPGETESYDFDFLIPSNICEVMMYSEFASQPNHHLHWSEETLKRLGDCHDES